MNSLEFVLLLVAALASVAGVYHQYFIANKVRIGLKVRPGWEFGTEQWKVGIHLVVDNKERRTAIAAVDLLYFPRRYLRFLRGAEHWEVRKPYAIPIIMGECERWSGFAEFPESSSLQEFVEKLERMSWQGGLYARVHFTNRKPITKRVHGRLIQETYFGSRSQRKREQPPETEAE